MIQLDLELVQLCDSWKGFKTIFCLKEISNHQNVEMEQKYKKMKEKCIFQFPLGENNDMFC